MSMCYSTVQAERCLLPKLIEIPQFSAELKLFPVWKTNDRHSEFLLPVLILTIRTSLRHIHFFKMTAVRHLDSVWWTEVRCEDHPWSVCAGLNLTCKFCLDRIYSFSDKVVAAFWIEFAYSRLRMRNITMKSTSGLETYHTFGFKEFKEFELPTIYNISQQLGTRW